MKAQYVNGDGLYIKVEAHEKDMAVRIIRLVTKYADMQGADNDEWIDLLLAILNDTVTQQ